MAVLVAILVALVVAAAVLLVASAVGGRPRSAGPVRTFRAGLAGRRHPDDEQRAAALAASVEPVDVSLDEFLQATADDGAAYLGVEELGATLHRAREKAARVIPLPRRD